MVKHSTDNRKSDGSIPSPSTKVKDCKKHGIAIHVLDTRGTWRCRPCRVDAVDKRRKKVKQKSVDLLGGKCELCGYNKYLGALEFHHKDPSQKDFNVTSSLSWSKIEVEVMKCSLLRANCHREEHERIRKER